MWMHNDWHFQYRILENDQTDNDPVEREPEPYIAADVNATECPDCFCRPCVTNEQFRQHWWDQANPPHRRNHKLRKPLYKRFWVMLDNRNAWLDPRYLLKKQQDLENTAPGTAWAGPSVHRREIMPDCVLKLVRQWRPNLPNQSYM
jgi:hypothetical protein